MNFVEKALATTILTAVTAFGSAAQAQQTPSPAPQPLNCTTIGQQKGVFEYPSARKAFQQEANVGCVYGYGAGGQFITLNSYNLGDRGQASRFNQEISQAQRTQESADRRDDRLADAERRRAEAEARRNNPVRQLENATRNARSVRNSAEELKRIFK